MDNKKQLGLKSAHCEHTHTDDFLKPCSEQTGPPAPPGHVVHTEIRRYFRSYKEIYLRMGLCTTQARL